MKERMYRRWSHYSAQDVQVLADGVGPEQYTHTGLGQGEFMPEYSEKLVGREFVFLMDCGCTYTYRFTAPHTLLWKKDDMEEREEYCDALELPDAPGLFLVQQYCKGSVPPTAHTIVLDCNTGLVTICIAKACMIAAEPRDISHTFCFGIARGYEDKGERHGFTEDLVGTAIYWTYSVIRNVRIKHIYSSPGYYTYQMTNPEGQCWMASNPADFLKIAEGIYVFTFLEDRQVGTQGFFLINMNTLHDVGSFFGIHAHGMECCMCAAKGELSEPYAFDWCETRKEPMKWRVQA